MAGTTVAFRRADPLASVFSPMHTGLAALTTGLRIGIYPQSSAGMPSLGVEDLTFGAWSAQGGLLLNDVVELPLRVGVGIAYHRVEQDLGTFTVTGSGGPVPVGEFESYERATGVVLGVGVEYLVRAGFGFTLRSIESNLSPVGTEQGGSPGKAEVTANAYGATFEIPIVTIATKILGGTALVAPGPPSRSLAQTKKLYEDAIKAFDARGVADEDIARFTGSIEASLINGLQSVSAKVSQLAQFETFTDNPNYIGVQLQRSTSVTKADVQRVYEKYVKGKPAVILSVATKAAPTNIVAAENFTIDKAGYKAPDYGYAGLKYQKPKDTFDRTKMPGSGPNPVVKVPPFWRQTLSSGVEGIGAESGELPVVALTFSMPGGHLTQAGDLSKAGPDDLRVPPVGHDGSGGPLGELPRESHADQLDPRERR